LECPRVLWYQLSRNKAISEIRIQLQGALRLVFGARKVPVLKEATPTEADMRVCQGVIQFQTFLGRRRHPRIDLGEAAAAHPDFFIFESLPGAGAVMAPRLLAAFGSQRERYGNAGQVQSYTGIAPVTETSGKKKWVHFRWACPKFLRQSFQEWAGHSIPHSVWARAYYQQQRSNGHDHPAAVRALAFKWIRVVFRCWKDSVAYDESKYLASLARARLSPGCRRRHSEKLVKPLVDTQWTIWEAIEKIKKLLDRLTQMSEASQGGVCETPVVA
jgi:hypothetical protein